MQRNEVLIVDHNDNPLGVMDKMQAHHTGILHRAFSVFLFDSNGHMLLQQRAAHKYHGAGLWTNACCSHPQRGEDVRLSALERLSFEMGMQCDIRKLFSFIYHAPVENNLFEHEYDHVFMGFSDDEPSPHPDEVQDYRWVSLDDLQRELSDYPNRFTVWFKTAIADVLNAYQIAVRI